MEMEHSHFSLGVDLTDSEENYTSEPSPSEMIFEVGYFRSLKIKLEDLNARILTLSRKGMMFETIPLREQALSLHRDIWGVPGTEVEASAITLVLALNRAAMENLASGKYEDSHTYLLKASALTRPSSKMIPSQPKRLPLRTLTLNNLGCFFKRTGKPRIGLKYLEKALAIEEKLDIKSENRCKTQLNIASIKSDLGDHEGALVHISDVVQDLVDTPLPQADEDSLSGKEWNSNLLLVAYFNLGVVLECLGRFHEARVAYQNAYGISSFCDNGHPLIPILKRIEEANRRPNIPWLCRDTVFGRDNRFKCLQRSEPLSCSRFNLVSGKCVSKARPRMIPPNTSSRSITPHPPPKMSPIRGKKGASLRQNVSTLKPHSQSGFRSFNEPQSVRVRPKSAPPLKARSL